jgi:hypothetical protein
MLLLFITATVLILVSLVALLFSSNLRRLKSMEQSVSALPAIGHYQPMLRLLSEEDIAIAAGNPKLIRSLRRQRREIFRGYLRCLTKDYGRLLTGIRLAMVNSGVDRPDLAQALVRNQMVFAAALCRIQIRLMMHTAGFGQVDVSRLVGALDTLRAQVAMLTPQPMAAAG